MLLGCSSRCSLVLLHTLFAVLSPSSLTPSEMQVLSANQSTQPTGTTQKQTRYQTHVPPALVVDEDRNIVEAAPFFSKLLPSNDHEKRRLGSAFAVLSDASTRAAGPGTRAWLPSTTACAREYGLYSMHAARSCRFFKDSEIHQHAVDPPSPPCDSTHASRPILPYNHELAVRHLPSDSHALPPLNRPNLPYPTPCLFPYPSQYPLPSHTQFPHFPVSQASSGLQEPDLPALTHTHTHTPASNPKPNPTYTHTFCPRAPSATHIPHRPISAAVLSLPPSPPLTPPLPRLPRLPLLPVLDLPLPPLRARMRNRRGLYQTNSGRSASHRSDPGNEKQPPKPLASCPRKQIPRNKQGNWCKSGKNSQARTPPH